MRKIILGAVVVILAGALFFFSADFLHLLGIIESKKAMNPLAIAGILVGAKALAAPLGLPGTPLTLLAGTLFGYHLGTLISIIGNTLGACLAFLLSRYVMRDYVQNKMVSRYPKIKLYEEKITRNGFFVVVLLRLIPLFPFNVLNFLLGVTNISFREYALGSLIGMIPGTFVYVYFGDSLRMPSIANIVLFVAGVAILITIGKFYEKRI